MGSHVFHSARQESIKQKQIKFTSIEEEKTEIMKRERNTSITKVKKRKASTSSESSDSMEENTTISIEPSSPRIDRKPSANKSKTRSDVTVRLQNADMFSKYKNKNPHLVIEQPKSTSNCLASEISDDDEIWLCEIPNAFDVNEMVGKKIKLGSKKCFVKTENGKIECALEKYESNEVYQNSVSIAFQNNDSQFIIKNIKPAGRLTFRARAKDLVDNPLENAPPVKPHKCTIFPDNIIVRHPLHGHLFEDRINVKRSVQEKLKNAEEASMHKTTTVEIKKEKDIAEQPNKLKVPKPKKSMKRKVDSQSDSESEPAKKSRIEIKVENDDDLSWIKSI